MPYIGATLERRGAVDEAMTWFERCVAQERLRLLESDFAAARLKAAGADF